MAARPGLTAEPVSKATLLCFQWAKAAPPRLSCCFFCPKPFFVSLSKSKRKRERKKTEQSVHSFLKSFYLFLKRGEARERNISVREKHQSDASCMRPNWGPNPQPRHVLWPGIKLATFCFVQPHPTQLSHTGQGQSLHSFKEYNVNQVLVRETKWEMNLK